MSAFNTFGGGPVQQARIRLRTFNLTESVTLNWPWINANTADIVAFTNRVTPSGPGLQITMPPADQAASGMDALWRNRGADSFEVVDNDGGSIVTVDPGDVWYVTLTDNSTAGGSWDAFQFGAGSSQVDAAALAGKGLIALASKLNQDIPVNLVVDDTLLNSDSRSALYVVDPSAGGGEFTFDPVTDLGDGWVVEIMNLGGSAWTLQPDGSETIDNQLSIDLNPNESCFVHAGESSLYTVGRGRTSQFAYTQNFMDVAGSTDRVLTTTQAGSYFQKYFGALTGNINIIVPTVVQPYVVTNNTTGAFTLAVKTAAGTGLIVAQGESVILHCDGTNVVDSDTVVPDPSALAMPDGSESAPGLAFASDLNLGFYRVSADLLGISANGQNAVLVGTTGVDTPKTLRLKSMDVRMWAAAIG